MDRILDIPIVGQLSPAKRREIKRAYESAAQELEDSESCEVEYEYINSKIDFKVKCTCESRKAWTRKMGLAYKALHSSLMMCHSGKLFLSPRSEVLIVAAIFYFVNPYDVIPDYIAGIGYHDDFYVLTLCLNKISPFERVGMQHIFNEILINETSE